MGGVPPVVEVVAEVEVRVVLVLGRPLRERGRLAPALDRELVALGVLLARHDRHAEPADLEVRADAEEALAAADQLARRLEEHVPRLDALEDLVLVAGVRQLDLVLEVEVVLRVVVDVDLELVADRAGDAQPELLPEVGVDAAALPGGGLLLLVLAIGEPDVDVRLPVHAEVDLVGAEDAGERAVAPAGHFDVEEREVAAALLPPRARVGLGAEGLPEVVAEAEVAVGVEPEPDGHADVALPDALGDGVGRLRRVEHDAALPVIAERRRERRPAARVQGGPEEVAADRGEQAADAARVRQRLRRISERGRVCEREAGRVGEEGGRGIRERRRRRVGPSGRRVSPTGFRAERVEREGGEGERVRVARGREGGASEAGGAEEGRPG